MRLSVAGCNHAPRTQPIFRRSTRQRLCAGLAALACSAALAACTPEYEDYGSTRSPESGAKKLAGRRIPQTLLAPERTPDCETSSTTEKVQGPPTRVAARNETSTASENNDVVADAQKPAVTTPVAADSDLAVRIKLEYERECYKQAERRVRARLNKLQAWNAEVIKAAAR